MKKAKKTGLLIVILTMAINMFTSCNDGMTGNGAATNGMNERRDKSKRTIIDAGKYIDLTINENDAKKFKKEDLLNESIGTYIIEGGNSYIKIDRLSGTIVLSSDDAFFNGKKGNNMYVKYSFDVEAANNNCLYIRMKDKKKVQLLINNETFINNEVPDLAVCVPLYGFGRNRIEVSSIMNGFIAMPSGTYWVKK